MPKSKFTTRTRRRTGRRRNLRPWILGGLGIVALIAFSLVNQAVRTANLPGEGYSSQGNRHVSLSADVPEYNSNPPTSGPHTPDLAPWGVYGPDEDGRVKLLIHNMEDGGVILWYALADDPRATRTRIATLEEAARGFRRVAVAPRPEMPTRYALTAWQRLQRFQTADVEAMRTFVKAYEGIDHHVGCY